MKRVAFAVLLSCLCAVPAHAQSSKAKPPAQAVSKPAPATTMPQVRLPEGTLQAQRLPAQVLDRRVLHQRLVEAREKAEREARERAARERVEARDAASREREARRIALGYTEKWGQGRDCDDTRPDVHPNAAEVCDLVDNDCDGLVDEGQTFRMFLDGDGDGHGDPARPVDVCPVEQQRAAAEGRWLVPVGNDCNDEDPERWQGCP